MPSVFDSLLESLISLRNLRNFQRSVLFRVARARQWDSPPRLWKRLRTPTECTHGDRMFFFVTAHKLLRRKGYALMPFNVETQKREI